MKHTDNVIHNTALDRDLHVRVYGEDGHPVIAFPAAGGTAGDWEDHGMVDAVAGLIESGRMQLFAVDSADDASWLAGGDIDARGAAQEAYAQFVAGDLLAFVKKTNGSDERPMTAGVDLGAVHALLALLRWPGKFEGAVAMSGIYDAKRYINGRLNSDWYNNSAVDFMTNLPADHPYVDELRKRFIVVAAGQGTGEETTLSTQRALDTRFAQLGLGAWFDYWGGDVTHDWSWWTKMAAYFLPTALDRYAEPAPAAKRPTATVKPAVTVKPAAAAKKPASKPAAAAKKPAPVPAKPASSKSAAGKTANAKPAPQKPAAKSTAKPAAKSTPKPVEKTGKAKSTTPAPKAAVRPASASAAKKPSTAKGAAKKNGRKM